MKKRIEGGNAPLVVKTCPFCGCAGIVKLGSWGLEYKAGCEKCDVFFVGRTPKEATEKWNRRAANDPA